MKKTDRGRRSWSLKEESTLVDALKDLIAQGWKSDNGFKAGYLTKLEEALRKVFPTTDLKGSPHVNSKINSWKKNYNSLTQILARSGAGFNKDGRHLIECEEDMWDQIVKVIREFGIPHHFEL